MLEAGCTAVGIADSLGIDRVTLYNRCPQDNNLAFSAFAQLKKAKGDDLLRLKQFQTAMEGNVTMQIWLGKQRLGQSDKQEANIEVARRDDRTVAEIVCKDLRDNGWTKEDILEFMNLRFPHVEVQKYLESLH